MEQYLDAKVKRYVQRRLFSKIGKAKTILGLAGTHPEEYIKVLPYHKRIVLVDFNPANDRVVRNSLVGEFDLLSNEEAHYSPITFVDCDFCKTYKNCGDDLLYIYNKMKKNFVRNKHISFTFSLRGAGYIETLRFLCENFPEFKRNLYDNCPFKRETFTNRRFYKQCGNNFYMYRDSGDIMVSGIIKVD